MPPYHIQNNPNASRFETQVDGHLAKLDYKIVDSEFRIDYVQVPPAIGGRGIGGALVREAALWAQKEGLRINAICGFARSSLKKMPEFTDSAGFQAIMSNYPPEIRDLAYRTRSLIYKIYPSVVEVPWEKQKTIGYGMGPKKMSEHFSWLAAHANHVDLGFMYGAELPDPHHLLEGTGKLLRHVKIRKPEDLQNPALHELLKFATTYRMPEKK